ncbi:MAG: tRNA pseudouridine(55) synthase TruB [Bacteroidetes bacterium]|nr:MAG: tRNA pseudouridine(55) synthase TruB [Bacteroidota bacterium]
MIDPQQVQEGSMLMIDKPFRWTSFDVVKKLRGALGVKKIGHAGTLDPLATGLLILCTGKLTKELNNYQALEKEYVGTLILGKTTPSIDLETDFDSHQDTSHLTKKQIVSATNKFVGSIQQVPPSYSAIKVDGQRVYNKARRGQKVELPPRTVEITQFQITHCTIPEVKFKVICSKGTYIRSLVRDFGAYLNTGAYLSSLVRTRIGPYLLSKAYTLEELLETLPSGIK